MCISKYTEEIRQMAYKFSNCCFNIVTFLYVFLINDFFVINKKYFKPGIGGACLESQHLGGRSKGISL